MTIDLGIAGLTEAELVGRGGSATVYKAVTADGSTMAVKVFNGVRDEAQQRHFERELEAMETLANINGVMPVTSSGVNDAGAVYLTMPYYPTGSLQQRIDTDGPLHQIKAVKITAQVAAVLKRAHIKNIFHRDLKPGNILIDGNGGPVIGDFGTTQIADGRSLSTTAAYTPGFCPPEALSIGRKKADGETSDVYSLGVTLWALLAARSPFSKPEEVELDTIVLINRIATEPLEELNVDDWVNAVVAKATAKQPADRYQTVDEFNDDLENEGVTALQEHSDTPQSKATATAQPYSADTVARRKQPTETPSQRPHDEGKNVGIKQVGYLVGVSTVAVSIVIGLFVSTGRGSPETAAENRLTHDATTPTETTFAVSTNETKAVELDTDQTSATTLAAETTTTRQLVEASPASTVAPPTTTSPQAPIVTGGAPKEVPLTLPDVGSSRLTKEAAIATLKTAGFNNIVVKYREPTTFEIGALVGAGITPQGIVVGQRPNTGQAYASDPIILIVLE